VHKNEELKVMVLDVDAENKRISLGIKQLQDDPWPAISERLAPGVEPDATVARVQDKGVVVDLGDDIEGFVPVSHSGVEDAERLEEYYGPGDPVSLRVIESDAANRRIVLEVTETPERKSQEEIEAARQRAAEAAAAAAAAASAAEADDDEPAMRRRAESQRAGAPTSGSAKPEAPTAEAAPVAEGTPATNAAAEPEAMGAPTPAAPPEAAAEPEAVADAGPEAEPEAAADPEAATEDAEATTEPEAAADDVAEADDEAKEEKES
jgi:small subunit ribosomal protein S1